MKSRGAAKSNELLDAYDWIRLHTTIDVDNRHIELTPLDEVDYGEMPGDPWEVVRRAHAVAERHKRAREKLSPIRQDPEAT